MRDQYRIGARDVFLQKTPYTFDVSVWELLLPLISGATLVFARPGGHRDPVYLQQIIQQSGITALHFVPSMLEAALESINWSRCPSLRVAFCSGEALSPALINRFRASGTTAELHNLYGPTEAAIDVSSWDCAQHVAGAPVSIGGPIQNVQLHVLGRNLQKLPVGATGEIYIGGVALARGSTSGNLRRRPRASCLTRMRRTPACGSIAPAIWRDACPTARSSTWSQRSASEDPRVSHRVR